MILIWKLTVGWIKSRKFSLGVIDQFSGARVGITNLVASEGFINILDINMTYSNPDGGFDIDIRQRSFWR